MSRKINFFIDNYYDDKKIKEFLRNHGVSHRMTCILKNMPDGILLNGAHARTIDHLKCGDTLTLCIPEDQEQNTCTPVKLPLHILYEDEDMLILNKQAMIAMHETHNHQLDALSNAVAYHLKQRGRPAVFRAVGRLDKGTSGIVVCALNKFAAAKLSGKLYKEYLAVAAGVFTGTGTINAPIYRPDPMKTLRCVDVRGEKAVTHWEALQTDGVKTLLKIHLETGRTHQIRVHFAHLGTPLIGDRMYGTPDETICHQALHCSRVKLVHPVTEANLEFTAPMPKEMQALL